MKINAIKRVILFEFECPRGRLEAHYDIDAKEVLIYGMGDYRGTEQERDQDGNAAFALVVEHDRTVNRARGPEN